MSDTIRELRAMADAIEPDVSCWISDQYDGKHVGWLDGRWEAAAILRNRADELERMSSAPRKSTVVHPTREDLYRRIWRALESVNATEDEIRRRVMLGTETLAEQVAIREIDTARFLLDGGGEK